jgi:hypothetical protein
MQAQPLEMNMSDQHPIAIDGPIHEKVEGYENPTPGGWVDYPLDELAIRDERRTAEDVARRIKNGRFVLDPDFQRGFVWDKKKQSRLIESILMRIPLPVFYVAEDAEGRFVVVDGRQRLTTLQRFLSGELRLDLEDRQELHKKKFKDLDARWQNRVEDCQLHFYIIDHAVPERARLDIFERVNGGEVLTRQQMRNAIYNGPATEFLRVEAESELFKDATGGSLDTSKMQDREFVNRFCSFHLLDISTYKGDMDDWLARGLVELGKQNPDEVANLRAKFQRALQNNLAAFGKHAFRKHRSPDQTRSVVNTSLFDVMMGTLAGVDGEAVIAHAEDLRQAFYRLMADEQFTSAITFGTNQTDKVKGRFEIAKKAIEEVFSVH